MEEIVYDYQFEKVFDDFSSTGLITEKEFFLLRTSGKILNKSEIKDFFDRKNTVFNEEKYIYLIMKLLDQIKLFSTIKICINFRLQNWFKKR